MTYVIVTLHSSGCHKMQRVNINVSRLLPWGWQRQRAKTWQKVTKLPKTTKDVPFFYSGKILASITQSPVVAMGMGQCVCVQEERSSF